jgi:septal ring factor EnvC (AmiA/AmiB activator)
MNVTAPETAAQLPLIRAFVCAAALACSAQAAAQSEGGTAMSLDELEAHIAEQKAALDTVIENRELTARKAESISEALEQAKAREAEVQAELETLCDDREKLEPGTKEACLKQNGG